MEIWRQKEGGWDKEKFVPLRVSCKKPLFLILKERFDLNEDHYLVFSKKEEKELAKLASVLYPRKFNLSFELANLLLKDVLGHLKETTTRNIYVAPPPDFKNDHYPLAVRFGK
ncbi:MAG: hypothetical protein Q7S73_00580 [bacterium]|nr:hypothetical protein [bacterium]